jgi:tripartite-type tricarboxylate transporter receptor subunit TctC
MDMLLGRRAVMAGLAGALATPALAQARFPDKPIRMMVPWTPGGATDIQMRALCEQAAKRLGQPIIVDNKPGAGGSLAAQFLAREARPDGYALAQMSNGSFRMPLLQDKPQWDPMQDFTWVIRLVGYMGGVVVRRDAPWRTMQELLADARANPGKFNYGTPGANTTDIQMTRLARLAGIDWVTVPFRGAAPNLQALLAGDIHFSAETSAWADMALEGRVRPLAVARHNVLDKFPHGSGPLSAIH